MNIGTYYLNLSSEKLEQLENKYNFIPNQTNESAANASLSHLCYSKTLEIAEHKKHQKPTKQLETSLAEMRHYAVRHYK